MADPMKRAAENVWRMLDQMAEKSPDEYKAFVDQQLKEGAGMFTPPEPAFCLCCSLKKPGSHKRIYINVCKWDRVPRPKTDSEPVAVKGGVLRHPTTPDDGATSKKKKQNKMAADLLIDVAFNPSVLEECEGDSVLRNMLQNLILDFVADFTSRELDRGTCSRTDAPPYVGSREDLWYSLDEQWRGMLSEGTRMDVGEHVLGHLKRAMSGDEEGNGHKKTSELPRLLPQRDLHNPGRGRLIQDVQDVKSVQSNNQPRPCAPREISAPQEALETSVFITEPTTSPSSGQPRKVKVKVRLPGVKSAAEVDLEVFEDHLQLCVPIVGSHMVQLPVPVERSKAKAAYDSGTKTLSVSIPCL